MMNEIASRLTRDEKAFVSPVFGLDQGSLDTERSSMEDQPGFIVCRFFAVRDECCPFELHFGRGENERRLNFYIGLGAEFYNYEEYSDAVCRQEIAQDVENFLRSEVHCEQYETSKAVAMAIYTASRLNIDGTPVRLEYRGCSSFLVKKKKRDNDYRPWIIRGD